MKKYKVLKGWDGVEVGEILDVYNNGYTENIHIKYLSPILAALLLHAGFIEEVGGPWTPQSNEKYWYVSVDGKAYYTTFTDQVFDREVVSYTGIYRTKEEAEAMRDKIQAFVKQQREI